ncbi:MAG: BamA/TamA family outer membrane protein [Candidatus Margulisiibacteriota bacterium]
MFVLLAIHVEALYIRKVVVNHNDSPFIEKVLIDRFQGTITNRSQIDQYIVKLRLDGIYKTIDYELNNVQSGYDITFNVALTQRIKRVKFVNLPFSEQLVIGRLSNRQGNYFNYKTLETDIKLINLELIKQGFFLASVYSITLNDFDELVVIIESPVVFDIDFYGLESTPTWYPKRDLLLKKGEVINQATLDIDFLTLQSLPLFSTVSPPQINYVTSENVLISYKVKQRKQNRLDLGIEELENNQGLALFGKVKRYNNLYFSDFVELQTQLSYLNMVDVRSYQFKYKQPWIMNRYPVSFETNVYAKYRSEVLQSNLDIYNTIRTGSSFIFAKQLRKSKVTLGAGVRLENVSPQTKDQFESYDIRSMSFFFEQNKITDVINPQNGYRLKILYDQGGDTLGLDLGGVPFSRFSGSHSRYYSVLGSQVVAFRLFGGVYNKYSSITTFETEKFSLGGANSLRGYPEFYKYGNYRLSLNLEQRFPLSASFLGVVFVDWGAIDDSYDSLLEKTYYGLGFGFRWLNTFMPIRLDFARGEDVMIHLGLSQTF